MPLDSPQNPKISVYSPIAGGIADRIAERMRASMPAQNPPYGNTGGTLGKNSKKYSKNKYINKRKTKQKDVNDRTIKNVMSQTTPPIEGGAKLKRTRAKQTSQSMSKFLENWFFDWLTLTIPNPEDGKGSKTAIRSDGQEREAIDRLSSWAALQGLRKLRVGRGSDGYAGGLNLAFDPTDSERLATIRAGHATNMPGLEIPGGRGHCVTLAPSALSALGPVMLARADVSLDVKREGLFEELHELCEEFAESRKKMEKPTLRGDENSGRTLYFGGKGASLKVYEKGKERVAKGTAEEGDEAAADDLIRIEFTLRGEKTNQKHGLAKIAADNGPGALLGTVCWIRRFVEILAEKLGFEQKGGAILAVQRIEGRPDPRPIEARARHGRKQYAGVFVREAAKALILERGENWETASFDFDELVEKAVDRLRPALNQAASDFVNFNSIGQLRDSEERAEDLRFDLENWLQQFQAETEGAKALLTDAETRALVRSGMPAEAPERVPAGVCPF